MSNFKIIKNWFYRLSELSDFEIQIWDNLFVTFFDDLKIEKNINISIWENTNLSIFWFLEQWENSVLKIVQNKPSSKLELRYLLLSDWIDKQDSGLKTKIKSSINANFCESDVKILSIAWNHWSIDLDWIIEISKWIEKVKWNLLEQNLFLGSKWQIKWIPTLLVKSNDVEASHACKIERISDEELFYLKSRWVNNDKSISMLLEAKVHNIFSSLEIKDKIFYDELMDKILSKF